MTERRTRATSVAATLAAEPPSRRTRAASVSANKRPEHGVKKATATPKRKRSVSAAPRSRSVSKPRVEPVSKRRESGRAKKQKTGDEKEIDEETRGRRSEREEAETEAVVRPSDITMLFSESDRRDRRNRLPFHDPEALPKNEHNVRFAVYKQDVSACSFSGLTDMEREELMELYSTMQFEEDHELKGVEREEDDATLEKMQEVGRMLKNIKSVEEKHSEGVEGFVKAVERATADGMRKDEKKAWLKSLKKLIAEERRLVEKGREELLMESRGMFDVTEEKLVEMGKALENAKILEEPPKETPKSRVKGTYFDTSAQGVVKAPLSARQHRTRLKEIADGKERADKEFEDLKAKFAEGIEFYENGDTNIAMIKGYEEKREEIRSLEEQYNEVRNRREDLDKVIAFIAKLETVKNSWTAMEVASQTTRARSPDDMATYQASTARSGLRNLTSSSPELHPTPTLGRGEGHIENAASPPPTAKKPAATEERLKKTPRRKSIRMGALSIFTPGGTRANSEAVEDTNPVPSSPLSPPPAEQPAPVYTTPAPGAAPVRLPETISWATPVSEIQDFLVATQEATAYKDYSIVNPYGPSTEQLKKFAFHPRPIGFKCPGHKREWRGAEQTKDLIIYRDWFNFPQSKDKEQLFSFLMTPRDISKPPTMEMMKSLKDWKAWGAGVITEKDKGGVRRTLYIFDPELSGKEVEKMKKTGELTKMQQLLVGAVKRCRGSVEQVVIEGRSGEEGEKDGFAATAEWANEIIGMGGMHMKERKGKNLIIAK